LSNEDQISGDDQGGRTGQAVDRAVRIVRLLDLYGPLLTERQREFVQLHYEEDLSFGEIAREHGISRQAVHDAVKHGELALEEYETKLQFSGGRAPKRDESSIEPVSVKSGAEVVAGPVEGVEPVIALLSEVHDRLKRSGGVIYNVDGILRDVGDALEMLRRLKADD
jgi:predicted DNA-binding protein YlxM (UPF0122 family)